MRLKKFLMSLSMLAMFLRGMKHGYTTDAPEDIEVYCVYEHPDNPGSFWVVVESKTFPELKEGQLIPKMEPLSFWEYTEPVQPEQKAAK